MYKCIYRVVTRRHKSLINDSHFVLKLLQQLRIITFGYEFLCAWLMQYVKGNECSLHKNKTNFLQWQKLVFELYFLHVDIITYIIY